jgi:EAL domain-containing protein (putative c-di-GMP-specific phosphodiesterase class I)
LDESASPATTGRHVDPSLLLRLAEQLAPRLDDQVERFYAELGSDPDARSVLAHLDGAELAHLKSRQAARLRSLLDPELADDDLLGSSIAVGHIHAKVGVETDWYARAVLVYQQVLDEAITAALDEIAPPNALSGIRSVLGHRLVLDLQGALLGYREVDAEQARVLERANVVATQAETVADLARGILDALAELDGLADAFFGRPDGHGRFQFEVAVGPGAESFLSDVARTDVEPITTSAVEPTGQGPAGRAWRSRTMERSDAYLSDPTTAPWHDLGRRFNWRSSAAVPLLDLSGEPRALLSLYARWPGYFAYSGRVSFLGLLRLAVEQALTRLETRPGTASAILAFADRNAHLERLDRQAVVMLYQPVVDLRSGQLVKFEALARLRADPTSDGGGGSGSGSGGGCGGGGGSGETPRDGSDAGAGRNGPGALVSPTEFLPAFGDAELFRLFEIGIDQALGALTAWRARGVEAGVAINLPTTSSSDDRYVDAVRAALAAHGVEPRLLTLELLETAALDGLSGWRDICLDQLRSIGVRLAQDDLGSGYSSLLRLRTIEFDEVKIDQGIVRDAERSPRAALTFIQPLTSLAHALGLTVTVEGLETDGLVEAAVFLGADHGQGFAIARPMPTAAVAPWADRFRLDVDRETPRTRLGALAAHLAWESRLAALGSSPVLLDRALDEPCGLERYLADRHEPPAATRAHRDLHAAATGGSPTPSHAQAWARLAGLLEEEG